MQRTRKLIIATVALMAAVLVSAGSCEDPEPGAHEKRQQAQDEALEAISERQQPEPGPYSPTLATIQFWLDTWSHEEGKHSFIYFSNDDGELQDYYVLEGLPVSYGTSGTPPEKWVDMPNDETDNHSALTQAPSLDGVWYTGDETHRYYAKEAVTGTFLDWTVSRGTNMFTLSEPIKNVDLEPAPGGTTKVEDVEE